MVALLVTAGAFAAAPASAGDKPRKDEKSYLYFRPAPDATSTSLLAARRPLDAPLPLLTARPADARSGSSLTFSPSGKAGDVSRGMSVQLRSRVQPGMSGQVGALAAQPAAYDFNLALGFHGFAFDAGLTRTAEATRVLSEGVNLGLSYGGQDWRTRLSVSDERLNPDPLASYGLSAPQRALAFELGSSVQVNPNWALTGGIRYAIGQSMTAIRLNDPNAPKNRSVFVGAAFSF